MSAVSGLHANDLKVGDTITGISWRTTRPNAGYAEFTVERSRPAAALPSAPFTVIEVVYWPDIEPTSERTRFYLQPNGRWGALVDEDTISADILASEVQSFQVLSEPPVAS